MVFVDNGKIVMMNRFASSTASYNSPVRFRIGIGTTGAVSTDTALESEVPIETTEVVDSCEATTGWVATGSNSITLNSSIYRVGSGALNVVKSDTSSAVVAGEKTTSSFDFTSKDCWVMIYSDSSDISSCELRFGSDSGNYYSFVPTLTDGGWNFVKFSVSTATVVGTPVVGACDYLYVGVTTGSATDTLSDGMFVFDNVFLASADDYVKDFEAGFPSVNEDTLEVSFRSKLSVSDANGFGVSEFGFENDDGTPMLIYRDDFSSISKTGSDEVIFITRLIF